MPELISVIDKDEIARAVSDMAEKISSEYKDRELILVGVLKGAFIFLSDLVRHLTIPVKIDFVSTSSYGSGTSSSGKVQLTKKIEIDINNKDIIIVEDIVDTGLTMVYLVDYFKSLGAKTVKICALIDKQERREVDIKVDYICHVVEEGFLVGYGLDYAESYRELPGIYHLKL
jgi:hypoxanthine phosphoribosyltransferase